jgi:hypothetical protein
MAFRFLALPGELRNAIYKQVFDPAAHREELGERKYRYNLDTRLLLTCKQIYFESRVVFYRSFVFVRIETPWDATQSHLQQEGLVPLLATEETAADFKNYHMNIVISAPTHGILDRGSRKVLLLADDMPKFCKIWSYWHLSYNGELNQNITLKIDLQDPMDPNEPLPLQMQKILLEPFGMIKKLKNVEINGIQQPMKTHVRRLMAVPEESQEKCLEEATRFKDLGVVALKKGDPDTGLDLFFKAFAAMHIICIGRHRLVWADSWFDRTLSGGPFDGQKGTVVRLVLRVKLVANILKAYLDKENYQEAWFWGDRTINLMRSAMGNQDDQPFLNFPAAVDTGKIDYRTGLAGKYLRKPEARRLFQVAHKYLPNDKSIQEQLG